jgi:hypothetical protein
LDTHKAEGTYSVIGSCEKIRTVDENTYLYLPKSKASNVVNKMEVLYSNYKQEEFYTEPEGKIVEFIVSKTHFLVLVQPRTEKTLYLKIFRLSPEMETTLQSRLRVDDLDLKGTLYH